MAFSVGNRIRVADQSSAYRLKTGTVKAVLDDDLYSVRIDGHGCEQVVTLHEDSLKTDTVAAPISYAQCAG